MDFFSSTSFVWKQALQIPSQPYDKRGGELILVFFLLVNIISSEYEVNVIKAVWQSCLYRDLQK